MVAADYSINLAHSHFRPTEFLLDRSAGFVVSPWSIARLFCTSNAFLSHSRYTRRRLRYASTFPAEYQGRYNGDQRGYETNDAWITRTVSRLNEPLSAVDAEYSTVTLEISFNWRCANKVNNASDSFPNAFQRKERREKEEEGRKKTVARSEETFEPRRKKEMCCNNKCYGKKKNLASPAIASLLR